MYRVQKKRRGGLYILILFFCAFAIGAGIGYGGVRLGLFKDEAKAEPKPKQETGLQAEDLQTAEPGQPVALNMVVPQETQKPERYLVIEQNGEVCVFTLDENNNRRFSHKLPVELEGLREVDQQLFRDGIQLNSKQELLELTEDFSS